MKRVLAFDFGASSGRAILAEYDGGALTYKEVHRFENCPRESEGNFRWDFSDLMANVRLGIEKAGAFDSVAFDTWGVDFGLLDENGELLVDPVHYRDGRTEGLTDKAFRTIDAGAFYAATGSQIMSINTLFQLLAVKESDPETWSRAKRLLFMPDLFAHALCGANACETTIASTSQMLDARTGAWSREVLDAFGIPETLFAPLVKSGTVVGEYRGARGRSTRTPSSNSWRSRPSRCAASSTPMRPSSRGRATSPAACASSAAAPGSPCLRPSAR